MFNNSWFVYLGFLTIIKYVLKSLPHRPLKSFAPVALFNLLVLFFHFASTK